LFTRFQLVLYTRERLVSPIPSAKMLQPCLRAESPALDQGTED